MSNIIPDIPIAEALYNELMRAIEPDLLKEVIPTLPSKYAGETLEERGVRIQRYKSAFHAYEKALYNYMNNLYADIRAYGKSIIQRAEIQSNKQEQEQLSSLENLFST